MSLCKQMNEENKNDFKGKDFCKSLFNDKGIDKKKILYLENKTPSLLKQKRKRENLNINVYSKDHFSKKENLLKYINQGKDCTLFNQKIEVDELISKGGFGSVFSGRLKGKLNKKILLKFLMRNVINKNEKPDQSEIIIHNKLRHKNICEVYGYFKVNEGSCIVMEYFKYGDIENFKKNILHRSTFSEPFLNYLT